MQYMAVGYSLFYYLLLVRVYNVELRILQYSLSITNAQIFLANLGNLCI